MSGETDTEPESVGPSWLGDFSGLVSALRQVGFGIGLAEELRARELLIRLAACRIELETPESLARWLGPVLCSTRREQTLFPAEIGVWARKHGWRPAAVATPTKVGLSWSEQVQRLSVRTSLAERYRLPIIIGCVGLAVAALAGLLWHYAPSLLVAPNPSPQTPVPSYSIELDTLFALLYQARFAAIPIALFAVWRRIWRNQKGAIERRLTLRTPFSREVYLTRSAPYLFRGLELHRPLQALRAHRRVSSTSIDIRSTLRATVAKAGRVQLRYARRAELPHYVLLVDRLSTHDHTAKIGELIALRMQTEQVQISCYEFTADPRAARIPGSSRPMRLADIATLHGDSPLILVSDGEGIVDPLSGTPYPWVQELRAAFGIVVLLTPVPLRRWGAHERVIAGTGIVVLPSTPIGLVALCDYLATQDEAPKVALERRPARMSMIGRGGTRALRWLLDLPPDQEEREALVSALTQELPGAAFELLCAMALFPQVRLDVTLHLGTALRGANGTPLLDEAALGALARLPWLRLGRMPDWLRLDLIDRLPARRESEVRKALTNLLAAPAQTVAAGDAMQIVTDEPRLIYRWLQRLVGTARGVQYKDAIFLSFMRGERPNRLALEAPDLLVRLLQPRATIAEWVMLILTFAAGAGVFILAQDIDGFVGSRLGSKQVNDVLSIGYFIFTGMSILAWHLRALAPEGGALARFTPDAVWLASAALILVPFLLRGSDKDILPWLASAAFALLFASHWSFPRGYESRRARVNLMPPALAPLSAAFTTAVCFFSTILSSLIITDFMSNLMDKRFSIYFISIELIVTTLCGSTAAITWKGFKELHRKSKPLLIGASLAPPLSILLVVIIIVFFSIFTRIIGDPYVTPLVSESTTACVAYFILVPLSGLGVGNLSFNLLTFLTFPLIFVFSNWIGEPYTSIFPNSALFIIIASWRVLGLPWSRALYMIPVFLLFSVIPGLIVQASISGSPLFEQISSDSPVTPILALAGGLIKAAQFCVGWLILALSLRIQVGWRGPARNPFAAVWHGVRETEAARLAEDERRQAEAARQAEDEKRRAEAARQATEEKRRAGSARQATEEKRRAEAARQVEWEKRRAEVARQEQWEAARLAAEGKRQTEAARQAAEEKQRTEAAQAAEEKQRTEAARQAAEEKQRTEAARQAAEEKQRTEAARRAEEEKQRTEAARRAEEEKRQAEAARQAEEEKRQAEAARQAAEQHLQTAEGLFARRELRAAIPEYEQAMRLDPDLAAAALIGIGDCHFLQGNFHLAAAQFEESIKIQPTAMAWRFLADAYDRSNRLDEAIEACRKSIETDPNYQPARAQLNILLRAKGAQDISKTEPR